jgi:hypothetical protein
MQRSIKNNNEIFENLERESNYELYWSKLFNVNRSQNYTQRNGTMVKKKIVEEIKIE